MNLDERLDKFEGKLDSLHEDMVNIRIQIAMLKTKAGLFGGIVGGALTLVATYLLQR